MVKKKKITKKILDTINNILYHKQIIMNILNYNKLDSSYIEHIKQKINVNIKLYHLIFTYSKYFCDVDINNILLLILYIF